MAVKKKNKRVAVKKTAGVKKTSGKKRMAVVAGSMCFWVNNGPVLSSLRDLNAALVKMSDGQFNYHVNGKKNDFAAWVKAVLKEEACARALFKAKTKRLALKAVKSAVSKYTK